MNTFHHWYVRLDQLSAGWKHIDHNQLSALLEIKIAEIPIISFEMKLCMFEIH